MRRPLRQIVRVTIRLLCGDALEVMRLLPDESVQCCITSPPYWGLRDYGIEGQLGLERTPEEYVAKLVEVFREVKRVLRADGTVWLNLGDCYNAYNGGAGPGSKLSDTQTSERPHLETGYGLRTPALKPKDLVGIPWRVAFALQADGWWLRSDIIWAKPNPMPESVTDRPTKAHEYLFLLAKSARYYYDAEAIREPFVYPVDASRQFKPDGWATGKGPHNSIAHYAERTGSEPTAEGGPSIHAGRNRRTVWTIPTQPFPEAHFATFPEALVEPCIAAGSREGDTVLDPFCGSGTVGVVCARAGRNFIGIDLNPEYVEIARRRIEGTAPLFVEVKT